MDDLALTMRRTAWERNKKTLNVPYRVDESVLQESRNLHSEGKYEAAFDLLSTVNGCTEDSRSIRIMGLSKLGLGHVDEAIELFSLARETSRTELSRDEVNLCMALLTAKQFEPAIAAAERAIELAPFAVGPHINMVAALKRSKDEARLEEYVLDLHENFPEVIQSSLFQERLERDPDFIGVAPIMRKVGTPPDQSVRKAG